MSIKQGSQLLAPLRQVNSRRLSLGVILWVITISVVSAGEIALQAVDVVTLAGNKLQIQLQMSGVVEAPLVFKTDNPARISLDFTNVSNALNKKVVNINEGVVSNLFIAEANDRTRVVVNLLQSVPYQAEVKGDRVFLTLAAKMADTKLQGAHPTQNVSPVFSRFLPKQGISNIDFKRGDKGEGRIIVALASPNTVVDTKEQGGKVMVNFLNTALPENLSKSLDVSDFATPVKTIDTQARGNNIQMSITPINGNYEYSSFQSEGYLTIEFRPLTPEEKVAQEKAKFTYVGEKLSLNFQDIEIRSVLQILADFTKLNIVASDNVTGKITLQMNDVPWDQALDLILKSKGLAKRQNGGVILVAPTEDINKIESAELQANNVQQQLEPLKTEYIQINFAKAENFRNLLLGQSTGGVDGCAVAKKESGMADKQVEAIDETVSQGKNDATSSSSSGAGLTGGAARSGLEDRYKLLSSRGTAIVDGRTNTLIVKDTVGKLVEIKKLIELLDHPVRQVMIESRIVIANKDFAQQLGVKFGTAKAANVGSGTTFAVGGRGTGGNINGGLSATDTLVDLGATAINGFPPGALGMTLARGADYVLNLEISALQDENKGQLLANPRVMTSDRCQAVIQQGLEIPYSVQTGIGVNGLGIFTIRYKEAVLQLDVTPQITPNNNIIMALSIKKDNPQTLNTDVANPRIEKRQITTTVTIENGQTVVLGGVFEGQESNEIFKIPFLGDLPSVGFLFRKTIENFSKKELLVFVTPKIVNDGTFKQ